MAYCFSLTARSCIALAILTQFLFAARSWSQNTDAEAILRAVESTRVNTPPSALTVGIRFLQPTDPPQRMRIEFDGIKRRFSSETTKDYCCIYTSTEMLTYDGKDSTTIEDPSASTSEYRFDPRVLGLSGFYSFSDTLEQCLGVQDPKDMLAMTSTEFNGEKVWHIRFVDKFRQARQYWIQTVAPFRVYKSVYQTELTEFETTSKFSSAPAIEWLPATIQTTVRDRKSRAEKYTRIVDISDVVSPAGLADSTFDISGLGMAVNTPVADIRIKQRIGYWDGAKLSADLVEVRPTIPVKPKSTGSRLWVLIVIACVSLAVGISYWYLSRRRVERR